MVWRWHPNMVSFNPSSLPGLKMGLVSWQASMLAMQVLVEMHMLGTSVNRTSPITLPKQCFILQKLGSLHNIHVRWHQG
eukprot:6475354-Amphidinium_carterae.1